MDIKRGLIVLILVLAPIVLMPAVIGTTLDQAFVIKGNIDACDDGIEDRQWPLFCTDCGHTRIGCGDGVGWPGGNDFPATGCYFFSVESDACGITDDDAYGQAALDPGFILPSKQEGGIRLQPTHEEQKLHDDSEWRHPFACGGISWSSNNQYPHICSSDHSWYRCDENEVGQVLDITVDAVSKTFVCLAVNDYFKWEDTSNLDLNVDQDQDQVPDVLDCAPNDRTIFPKFGCITTRDADGKEVTNCVTGGAPEVCGDHVDNNCTHGGDPRNFADDCDADQLSCQNNCLTSGGQCSWRDSAETNNCCGDDGINEVGQTLRGREGTQYVCLNKENPALISTVDRIINWAGCDESSKDCWLAAASDPFHIYTFNKPGEPPYDVVSNNNDWFVCDATTGEGTLGINAGAAVVLPGDIKESNGLYCSPQGNRWGWAQCGDTREPTDNNVRQVGDGPFALAVESIVDNVVQLKKPAGRFDIPVHNLLEFRTRFTGPISVPADIQLFITGTQPNGERIIYVDENVSALAVGSPLLEAGRWMHISVPLPEMLNIESLQLKAYPSENLIEVANVYLHSEGSTPPLCSGEGSTNHDETAWLLNVDFWQTRSYNAKELCNALYSPHYTPDDPNSKTAWLGSTVPGDRKCCGNTPGEYYAGVSEENNGQQYGCWNSQPIKAGDTVMNVDADVASMTKRMGFTYPEERFDVAFDKSWLTYDSVAVSAYRCPQVTSCSDPEMRDFTCDDISLSHSTCQGQPAAGPNIQCTVGYLINNIIDGVNDPLYDQVSLPCPETNVGVPTDTYEELPIDDDFETIYHVTSGSQQGYYRLTHHTESTNFNGQTISLSNSPQRIASIEVDKEDFRIKDEYRGYLRLGNNNPRVEIYFLNPLDGTETHSVPNIAEGGFITNLNPKSPGKSTLYLMAKVNENYQITATPIVPESRTTHISYACTPDASGATQCTYPLPGSPPYTITNPHPDLYELYFISKNEEGAIIETLITNAPGQAFNVPGNLRAKKVAQQVLFVSQEEPLDQGFYACQAANYLQEGVLAARSSLESLPYCSVKAGQFCSYSISHQPSDNPHDQFTTINSWSKEPLEKIGYAPLETTAEQPDVNTFYTANELQLKDDRKEPFERNYSSSVLPARNFLSNAEFQPVVRDLPHWEIVNAEGTLLEDERSTITETTITLTAGMLLRSERVAVPPEVDLHVSFEGTAAARVILVDKDGNQQPTSGRDFNTGDASYLILEFTGPGTVHQPMVQRVDELGPASYQYNAQYTARAGAACCPQNYCWNGYACVEPMGSSTYLAEHISDGRDYRCINGAWTYQPVKVDWNADKWGFCSSKDQCLVLNSMQGGDNTQQASNFYQGQYPTCINDKEFIFDNYCDKGNWTSRTKFIATKLLDIAGSDEYVLYCADYRTALNEYQSADNYLGGTVRSQGSPPPGGLLDPTSEPPNTCYPLSAAVNELVPALQNTCVNNVCVLKRGGSAAFAATLNPDLHDTQNSFLLALNVPPNKIHDACRGEGSFVHCNAADLGLEGDLWYSSSLNAVIYSKESISVTPTLIDKLFNFFKNIFTGSSLSEEREFVSKAQNFKDIYLANVAGKKVRAIKEVFPGRHTLVAEYENFNTPVCDYINTIAAPDQVPLLSQASGREQQACAQNGTIQRVEMLQNIDFFWPKLTGELRVK